MEIITKIKGGIAISPRANVYFNSNELLVVGYKGLSKENLERLVEIGLADVFNTTVSTEVTEKIPSMGQITGHRSSEYRFITNKNDLQRYAKVTFGIYVDKRLTVEKMIEEIEKQIKI